MTSFDDEQPAPAEPTAEGPSARFGRSLAVVIGIDTYGEGIAPLRSAVADATAIAEALRRDHGFETWCLFDDDARRVALLDLLREELPDALGPDDRLLFYFAGHGIALDGDDGPAGYLVPAGVARADRDGFLPMRLVHGALSQLRVRHALVILDCCFAGTFRWSSLRDLEPAVAKIYRERYDRYVERPAWQVLTSASGDQLALDVLANERGEGAGAHSPFALALLEGLAGAADYTQDNVLTADELAILVRTRVAPAAESVGHRQIPQLFPLDRHDGGQFVFQVPNRPLALEPAPPLDEDANPYRGLESFRERDRALFFGRTAAAARLVDAIAARQLTVVVGPSGSGKSSLVHAGALPALRARGWAVLPTQRPGREPLAALDALARALRAEPELTAPAEPPEPPEPPGPAGAVAAWLAAAAARAARRPDEPCLVVIDQLEELLTHRAPEREQAELLGALAAALEAAPSLHLVVTVRSDIEPQLHDSALGARWSASRFVVPAMTRDELREAIEKPAREAVLHFAPPSLVERLIDDVALLPAPLPLLSFALGELYRRCWARWQAGARDRALREADHDELGSVARALTGRATALHDELVAKDAAHAITIRNVFHRMVAIVSGERARRRVSLDELAYGDPAEDRRVEDVLERFHEARLISLGTEPGARGGATRYAEPTHDELVRGWALIGRWLDELDTPPGTRALLGAVGRAVRTWQQGGHADALLWSDPRAEQARELLRAHRFVFNAREARFVRRSTQLRRARRTRGIAGLIAGCVALAAVAVIALGLRAAAVESAGRAERLLARSYQESGRQLTLSGRALEAIPYLVEARRAGASGAPLQMLFAAAAREVPALLLEHAGAVRCAAVSPDGARVVTVTGDAARVWDAASGAPLGTPLLHDGEVTSAAFSPDGARVVTASWDHTARIWDAASGAQLGARLQHGREVASAAFSPDGARVVTASWDHTARIWSAASGEQLGPPLPHAGSVVAAAFGPDGARVVTASSDHTARVWDAASGQAISEPLRHEGSVVAAALGPDGARVVTASADHTARIWDAATGELLSSLRHTEGVTSAAFSPDGASVVTASADRTARVWEAATGSQRFPPLKHGERVAGAAFSPDGTRVVTASDDKAARVWDAATGSPIAPALAHQGAVTCAAFSPDGRLLVTASADRTARIWHAPAAPATLTLQHDDVVRSTALSPDGARVVTASDDGTARIWDAETGERLGGPLKHRGPVQRAAFSPDGALVVTASGDHTARVWDAETGDPLGEPLGHGGPVNSAAFSPDGARVVTASSDHTARVWDATSGRPRSRPLSHEDLVTSAAFSPDGARVVTASDDNTARVWIAATGELVLRLEHEGAVTSAAFSPDGARIVTASDDNTARVWRASSGRLAFAPLPHERSPTSAAFSPDGARIVTASRDGTALIWDAATGHAAARPLEHDHPVTSAAFSRDGTRVITASGPTAQIWDASSGQLLAPPLRHHNAVRSAVLDPGGTRLVTAAGNLARVRELPLDRGSLARWRSRAASSPFVLKGGVLARRPPPGLTSRAAGASGGRGADR